MSNKLKEKIADNRFSKDSVQKEITAGYKKGDELLKFFNLNLGKMKEILPNDAATVIHISRRETDRIFLMEDGSIVNLEFQDKYTAEDIRRFFLYCAALYERYDQEVNTIVIYTKTPPKNAVYDFKWNTLYFSVIPIVLSELKREEILKPILSKIEKDPYSELDTNEKLTLMYSLFMDNRNIEENLKVFYNLVKDKIENFEVQKELATSALLMVAEETNSEISVNYVKELVKMMNPNNQEEQEKLKIITEMIKGKKVQELEERKQELEERKQELEKQNQELEEQNQELEEQNAKQKYELLKYKHDVFVQFKSLNFSESEALKLAGITPVEYEEIKLLLEKSPDNN